MLANPIFLWSLLGLSIPFGIHLLSRKEGKIIRIGSIRHIEETSTQQFKGIRLNELLLLFLRCLMIIIFSLLLSGLQCTSSRQEKWVVVERGLETMPSIKTILDSLKKDGYEQHQLADGFPMHRDSISEIKYWKLAEQLELMNLSSTIVFATDRLENFKGNRIALTPNIKWISVPLPQIDYPLQAIRLDNDSIVLRTGHSNANETYFQTEKLKNLPQPISISPPDSIRVLIVSDDSYAYDRGIIIAALKAIEKSFPIKMKVLESKSANIPSSKVDWRFWLSGKKIPENNSIPTISIRLKNSNDLLLHFKSNEWDLTKRLNEEIALDENLTLRLAELILPSNELHEIARANDRQVMPDSMAWSQVNSNAAQASILTSSADQYLIILLLFILVIERIIAFRRNQ